jgi:thioredoxin-related protein
MMMMMMIIITIINTKPYHTDITALLSIPCAVPQYIAVCSSRNTHNRISDDFQDKNIISLNSINVIVLTSETQCVFCDTQNYFSYDN